MPPQNFANHHFVTVHDGVEFFIHNAGKQRTFITRRYLCGTFIIFVRNGRH